MEPIDYAPLLPVTPPLDLVSWALEHEAFRQEYLIYQAGRAYEPLEDQFYPAVEVVCTHCGRTFRAQKIPAGGCYPQYAPAPFGWIHPELENSIISGTDTICPCCGCEAKTVHIGTIPRRMDESVSITVMSRLSVEGHKDRFVLTDWMVRRLIDKSGQKQYITHPYTAWVVEEKKVVRLMGYTKYMNRISLTEQWMQRKTFVDVYGRTELLVPWDKRLLEGTTAENSKLDLYLDAGGRRPVAYLALWRKRPAIENLLMQGCERLVVTWLEWERSYGLNHDGIPKLRQVDWKEKRPAQMLGLNKEEFRQLRRLGWDGDDLERYKLVRDAGLPVKLPEDMQLLRSRQSYELNRILDEGRQREFWRTLRYLQKQGREWSVLRDYWQMARKLGRDVSDSLVRWPRSLTAAHDRLLEEQTAREHAALHELFLARAEELEPLSFARDGLLIRPCRTEAELIREGKDLHHCVANYAQQHAEGRTAILFLRRAAEPDKPYFTLEFDETARKVRQNRGLRNCGRTPEVTAFETAWLDYVRSLEINERTRSA